MSYVGKRAIDRQCLVNLEPDMLRGEDQDGGGGFSCGGDSPQQSSRRWENQGPLRRICYEFSVVASQLKRAEATKGDSKQVDDIVALWRKRSELAKRIVEAAASTIEDVVLKMAMTEFLLLEGDLRVGLIPQCLEECDRALAQEGDGEPCLEALERELWALCERVEHQTAALEARWDCVEQSEEVGGPNDARADFSLARAWNELNESIWSVARYETMTPIGLRAKGTMFRDLLALVGAMDGLSALQELIPARLRSPGISSPSRERLADASPFRGVIAEEFSFAPDPLKRRASDDLEVHPMPRHFLIAMSVSLVALSTPAFAGPGDSSNSGGVVQSGRSEPGIVSPAPPGARFGE